jgi:DNA ligase (NAD+)
VNEHIEKLTLQQKQNLYLEARHTYYESPDDCHLSDAEYDELEDFLRAAVPDWPELKKTGTPVLDKKVEVALPRVMPSLDKIYPEDVAKWSAKQANPQAFYAVLNKYDGSSIYLRYQDGNPVFAATRGDGIVGKNISFLIPFLNIPRNVEYKQTLHLRCECVLRVDLFNKHFSIAALGEKLGKENPRQVVAGLLNRTLENTKPEELALVDVIVLGVYDVPITKGFNLAAELGFTVARGGSYMLDLLTSNKLSSVLDERIEDCPYEIDGLVLLPIEHIFAYVDADKPKWTIAFKKNTDISNAQSATVTDIIYDVSRTGRLTPVAVIEPTPIGGVTVTHVSMANVELMCERGVGPGAVIKVVRSGDVIPFWVATVKRAEPKYPSIPYRKEGVWLYAINASKEEDCQRLLHFFTTCGIENIALKSIEALYDKGFVDCLKYVSLVNRHEKEKIDAIEVSGIGPAKTNTLIQELNKLKSLDLVTLILATGVMPTGIGRRKMRDITACIAPSNLLHNSFVALEGALYEVPGFQQASVEKVIAGLKAFREKYWIYLYTQLSPTVQDTVQKPSTENTQQGSFTGMTAYWTGYRSPEQEAAWAAQGGTVASSFGARTSVLFWKPGGKKSSKVLAAGDRAKVWEDYVQ